MFTSLNIIKFKAMTSSRASSLNRRPSAGRLMAPTFHKLKGDGDGGSGQIYSEVLSDLSTFIDVKEVLSYLRAGVHEDGGYCFVQYLNETNINDTYYAIETYITLGLQPPHKELTAKFLMEGSKGHLTVKSLSMVIGALNTYLNYFPFTTKLAGPSPKECTALGISGIVAPWSPYITR